MAFQDDSIKGKQVVVVMVPLPAQGHLNQLLHLSRLISAYDIPVHYVSSATHNRQAKSRTQGWDPLSNPYIIFHELPVPEFNNPNPDPNSNTKFPTHILPSFYAALKLREPIHELVLDLSSTTKRVVVIHDSFMTYHVQDIVSNVPNAETYCFYSTSVFTFYSLFWESAGKPSIPESSILEHLPRHETMMNKGVYELSNMNTQGKKTNSGNLYNTCREIEGRYIDLISQFLQSETDKNWAIGPFNPVVMKTVHDEGRHECLKWLDKQSVNSVIFVSFGSTTTLTNEEIDEIAVGLERSGQKFIWVLREADKGDIFTEETIKNPLLLPEGYEERIKDRGMVIREWAPQLEILGHSSTGGFMSHCGWNSTIESISLGVPIAAWPMHSDQPRNAILITEVLKIGILVRDWDDRDQVVKAETIANVVTRLMDSSEGKEILNRTIKLSESVKNSVMKGGQSHLELESFIAHITR